MDTIQYKEQLLRQLISKDKNEHVRSVTFLDCDKIRVASAQEKALVILESGKALNIFIKSVAEGSPVDNIDKQVDIFKREHMMYSLLATMAKYQEKVIDARFHDQNIMIKNLFPKYYGRGIVEKVLYLVFEDFVTETDFFVTAKESFHAFDQVKSVMINLGAFHAVSYAMKMKHDYCFMKEYPLLEDSMTDPKNEDLMAGFTITAFVHNMNILDAVDSALKNNDPIVRNKIKSGPLEKDIRRLKMMAPELLKIMHRIQSPQEPGALVTHGDFHMFNMAFTGDHKIKFFDLQMSRYSSGIIDIHHYLSQTTTPHTRANHLSDFLSVYLKSFNDFCYAAKVIPLFSDTQHLLEEYRAKSPWGLFCGLCFILWRFVENREVFENTANILGVKDGFVFEVAEGDLSKEDDQSDTKDINIIEELNKCGDRIWWCIQVLLDIVKEMSELGTIDIMECVYNDIIKQTK